MVPTNQHPNGKQKNANIYLKNCLEYQPIDRILHKLGGKESKKHCASLGFNDQENMVDIDEDDAF